MAEISRRFVIPGVLRDVAPLGRGHINDTFVVTYELREGRARYVHQRINDSVLADPLGVMANIGRVLDHLHEKLAATGAREPWRRALTLVPARDGASCVRDDAGKWWRTYLFIERAHPCAPGAGTGDVFEAAKAFAAFARLIADLPSPALRETIAGFHDTPAYLAGLRRAVAQDPLGRAAGAAEEIAFALAREPLAVALRDLADRRLVGHGVVHNDTKIDNVLLDDASGQGLCVLDLDTVMPGLVLYDLGDLIRSASSSAREDERDPARVRVEPARFEAIVRGTLAGAEGTLGPGELENMVLAGRVVTYECGMRFLTDHLLGDTYFRLHRPGQNLDRARAQFRLVHSLEANEDGLRRIVDRARARAS